MILATSVSVAQGGTSTAIAVSINPQNGFTGQVQVSLSALPAAITASPVSPFSINASAGTSLLFTVSGIAATGTDNITLTAASGNLAHTSPLTLTIQTGLSASLPRSNYVRNNVLISLANHPGEPYHRRMVLDAAFTAIWPVELYFSLAHR